MKNFYCSLSSTSESKNLPSSYPLPLVALKNFHIHAPRQHSLPPPNSLSPTSLQHQQHSKLRIWRPPWSRPTPTLSTRPPPSHTNPPHTYPRSSPLSNPDSYLQNLPCILHNPRTFPKYINIHPSIPYAQITLEP
jgi:hypothetical protein